MDTVVSVFNGSGNSSIKQLILNPQARCSQNTVQIERLPIDFQYGLNNGAPHESAGLPSIASTPAKEIATGWGHSVWPNSTQEGGGGGCQQTDSAGSARRLCKSRSLCVSHSAGSQHGKYL